MTATQTRMTDLYEHLTKLGLPKTFVREKILPDWWDDELDNDPDVWLEGAGYVARRLNVDFSALIQQDAPLKFHNHFQPKYKLTEQTSYDPLAAVCAIATSIAGAVSDACIPKYQELKEISVAQIRQTMLERHQIVDLEAVLEFCWNRGIPVIHLTQFPEGCRRFHGMITFCDNRPVIVVSLQDASPSG
jgi:hypothetical protein